MFNKLLSNLPFNPSLIGQVAFYAKRLHKEAGLRRIGFIFVLLAFMVQFYAIQSPPAYSLDSSSNDIIRGGFTTKDEAVLHCLGNTQGFATILAHFGITCANLGAGQIQTIRSTDDNNRLYSMGRKPYGKPNETPIKVRGLAETFYMRPLSSWDSRGPQPHKVLSVGNIFAVHYYIMLDCGNIVQHGKPEAPAPAPTPVPAPTPAPKPTPVPVPQIIQPPKTVTKPCIAAEDENDVNSCLVPSKKARNDTQNTSTRFGTKAAGTSGLTYSLTAKAGDVITYTLSVENTGSVAVQGVQIEENMLDVLEYADITDLHGATLTDGVVRWPKADIAAKSTLSKQLTVKVKDPIPGTTISASDRGSFDLIMTNVYNDTVNIKLPATAVKAVEQVTTQTLPNTGPGTTMAIGVAVTVISGYFFFRSRLLAQELDIVRHEYAAHGGA